ncbi:MAG: hypothetical protein PVS2B2_04630 [Candidatus Acidiferrum sp.]
MNFPAAHPSLKPEALFQTWLEIPATPRPPFFFTYEWQTKELTRKTGVEKVRSAFADSSVRKRVPKWEEMGYTQVVFVSVANTGVAIYGKRKSAQELDGKELARFASPTKSGNVPNKAHGAVGVGKSFVERNMGHSSTEMLLSQ